MRTHYPAVAGSFYPRDASSCAAAIDACVKAADVAADGRRPRAGRGVGARSLAAPGGRGDRVVRLALQPARVLAHAQAHQSACGAGAIAAALAAAHALGANHADRLAYTTSADVRPDLGAEDFVGYAAIMVPCP